MSTDLITKIHTIVFQSLKSWADQSSGNWNILIGTGFLLLIGSIVLVYSFYKKIGQEDERTSMIFLKSSYCMLLAIILCDVIFPKDDMWTIFFLFKYALSFLAGGLYMAVQYRKDFL